MGKLDGQQIMLTKQGLHTAVKPALKWSEWQITTVTAFHDNSIRMIYGPFQQGQVQSYDK